MESALKTERTLKLLADGYARELLNELSDEPLSAPELVTRCAFSRTTVYRRLEQLESAGLVEVTIDIRRNGNHRRVYRPAVEQLTYSIGDQQVEGTVRPPAQSA